MIKKILISVCFLLTQFLPIMKAQAYPGYSSFDTKVRDTVGCGQNNVSCLGSFELGKPIYSIQNDCIYNNVCAQPIGKTFYSNDAYQLYQVYISQFSQYMGNSYPKITVYNAPTQNNPSSSFTIGFSQDANSEYMSPHGGLLINVNCDYNEALGCADDNLDRTSMDDGPCDICSKIGNPFDVRNGAKYEYSIDLNFPILLKRNYSSRQRVPGMFGANWRSNFDKVLNIIKNNGIITSLLFVNPNGEYIVLQSNDGNTFTPLFPDQLQYKVNIENNRIKLIKPDSSYEIYDMTSSKIIAETYKGKTITYQYFSNGLLQKVSDSFGRNIQFSYNIDKFVNQVNISNGDILKYDYNSGNVTTIKYNNIPQITYEYTNSLLTGKRDGNNIKYASFSYDILGRGIENKWLTSDGHEIKKYTLNYDNNVTKVTQENGFSKDYIITSFNKAKKISNTNGNGVSEQVDFDSNGNITAKKDINGFYENYMYDNEGKIHTYLRNNKTINLIWDNEKNITKEINENTLNGSRTTTNFYDDKNNDLGYKVTGNNVEAYVYRLRDSNGRLTREENDQGLVKTYTYYNTSTTNESSLLKSITTNTGYQLLINSYDLRGNPTSITVDGVTKTMSYDYKSRILSETMNGATNNYTYDNDGNMITSSMANGYQLIMVYDTAGRLLSIQDNAGGLTTLTNDDYTGEVLKTSISQNNILVRERNKIIDALGRTVESWNSTIRTKQLENYYINATNPDSTTDANGKSTNYTWNSQGLNSQYSNSNDNASKEYDMDGNLTKIIINNQTTNMNYDDLGRLNTINNPDTGNSYYFYSKTEDSYTDAKETVHTTNKGIGGLVFNVTHINNDSEINYNIYENYNYDMYGRLKTIQSNNSEITYKRNILGQLIEKKTNITPGVKSFTIQYGYNSIGQKTTETYPSGLVVTYGYTKGFLTSILTNGTPIVSNIQYNSMLKEPISWNLGGNNVSVNKDSDGLLTSFVESSVFNQSITTDNEGHIISLTDNVSNNNFNVSLTDNYALQSGSINGKNLDYTFEVNNNVTLQKDGVNIHNYDIEYLYGTNKIEKLYYANSDTHFDFKYDRNGNLRVDNKARYNYDAKNNLEYLTDKNGNVFKYYYNGLNQRVAKEIQSGQLRYFVYNENNQLIGEYDNAGNIINEYVYFGLRPVAVKTGNNLNIIHTDYLGTPRVITSGTNGGSMIWQWKNDNPYGNNEATGSIEFNLRFTGQYYDSESRLHYNIHRTYDPETGRYIQSDPIGLAGGSNTYNYVNRNPLNAVDPLGLFGISGTNNSILTEAIHNPLSVPSKVLGITMHSKIDTNTGYIGVELEAGSELYNYLKIKNPNKKSYKNNENLILTAEGLAQIIKENFNLDYYESIDLKICNLGSHNNKNENILFAKKFSSETNKTVLGYTAYITATKNNNKMSYFSGYYTNPYLFRFGLDYNESFNGESIKLEFKP